MISREDIARQIVPIPIEELEADLAAHRRKAATREQPTGAIVFDHVLTAEEYAAVKQKIEDAMTAQELIQQIHTLIKEAYDRAEGRDESYRIGCYALALSDIERLCRKQLLKEPVKR